MKDRIWTPLLDTNKGLESKVMSVSSSLVKKLFMPEASKKLKYNNPELINNFSLAGGSSGLALLAGTLDNINQLSGWDVIAHRYLSSAAQKIKNRTLNAGLFSGLAGLSFTATYLSKDQTRYNKFLTSLNKVLYKKTLILSDIINKSDSGISTVDFDLISGITGIGAYLLYKADNESIKYLKIILSSLINNLSKNNDLLGFYTPFRDQFKWKRDLYRYGSIDLGMSHGVAGPLALLSVSKLSGIKLHKLTWAIAKISEWFIRYSMADIYGTNWPSVLPVGLIDKKANLHNNIKLNELRLSKSTSVSRTAWCYGAPGISRALFLAGKAVNNEHFINFSLKAIKSSYKRPFDYGKLDSPTFCHGLAGILQIYTRFYNDTKDEFFKKGGIRILKELLNKYNERFSLGYRNLAVNNKKEDNPFLLEGTTGILLSLYSTISPLEPKWDKVFLLS